jgi:hypothetical protein
MVIPINIYFKQKILILLIEILGQKKRRPLKRDLQKGGK